MSFPLLLRSMAHTRPSQLARRLLLTAKRQILWRFPRLSRRRGVVPPDEVPPLRPGPPTPPLPARSDKVVRRDGLVAARFLNREFPLRPPIAWHPPELEVGGRRRTADPAGAEPSAGPVHLAKITLHYMEYLEGLDDGELAAVVDDWIAGNPPYRRGYWLDDWNSYALSLRTVVWMQEWRRRGLQAGTPFGERLLGSLAAQLRFLEDNLELDIGGNHLLKNVKALLWAGRFFDGEAAGRWTALGRRLLRRELREQVLADGLHYERSPAYHCQAFVDLLECRHVLDDGDLRSEVGGVLRAMAQALADLTHPDGRISLFNDGGLHMTYDPRTCLDAYRAATGREVTPRRVFALPEAGYFGARSDDDLVLVDCGPIAPDHLPAHGHGDILSFEWSLAGKRVVVDAGVFEYDPGPARDWSRATAAHNTVTLDDADQCEFWSSFRVGRRARASVERFEADADGFDLDGNHDGYRRLTGGPLHRRRFRVRPRRIEVRDEISGGAGQTACARLLLAPGFRPGGRERGRATFSDGATTVELRTEAPVRTREVWWYPDFGVRERTLQIELDYGSAPCAGGFLLASVD